MVSQCLTSKSIDTLVIIIQSLSNFLCDDNACLQVNWTTASPVSSLILIEMSAYTRINDANCQQWQHHWQDLPSGKMQWESAWETFLTEWYIIEDKEKVAAIGKYPIAGLDSDGRVAGSISSDARKRTKWRDSPEGRRDEEGCSKSPAGKSNLSTETQEQELDQLLGTHLETEANFTELMYIEVKETICYPVYSWFIDMEKCLQQMNKTMICGEYPLNCFLLKWQHKMLCLWYFYTNREFLDI